MKSRPILYSFRRCPYAMRARLALASASIECELREVVLRDKPPHMLEISPKATVPVLLLPDGSVIDESLEIMLWSLRRNDPGSWLLPENADIDAALSLIHINDTQFKHSLDRYKYPDRYENSDADSHRAIGEAFVVDIERRLNSDTFLFGSKISIADMALLPFIRQFANTDRQWFDSLPYKAVHRWLYEFLQSPMYLLIMKKYPQWRENDAPVIFPNQTSVAG